MLEPRRKNYSSKDNQPIFPEALKWKFQIFINLTQDKQRSNDDIYEKFVWNE